MTYDTYGGPEVLRLREVDTPVPGDGEVLVRVRAAGLNPYDWHFMRGLPYLVRLVNGLRKPRRTTIIGSDMAGVVEATGPGAIRFAPGDEVFAEVGTGACADHIAVAEDRLARKPVNLSFEQAAVVPMAAETALRGVRDRGSVQPGHKVLINGASGGVGTFAVQLAKHFGAEVTGVCGPENLDMVRSIGADHVIDYTREDFTRGTQRYDLILDCVASHTIAEFRRALTPNGTLGATGAGGGRWLGPALQHLELMAVSPFVSQRLTPVNDRPNRDLGLLRELIEGGQVTPVIDRTHPLDETADAIRYLEAGHARGKIAVTV